MFRYERLQAGKQRQFHQIGLEWLSAEQVRSDVEVISLAWDLLASLGFDGLQLELNSLGTAADTQALNACIGFKAPTLIEVGIEKSDNWYKDFYE